MKESSLQLQSSWDEVKEKLKEINTSLTDDDLAYQPGKEDELVQRLAAKMKKKPDEIKALIESVSSNHGKAS